MESPEQMAQLRQVMRKAHQLPEPDWNLFARTTRKWSRLRPEFHRIETQQKMQKKKDKKKKNDKVVESGQK